MKQTLNKIKSVDTKISLRVPESKQAHELFKYWRNSISNIGEIVTSSDILRDKTQKGYLVQHLEISTFTDSE